MYADDALRELIKSIEASRDSISEFAEEWNWWILRNQPYSPVYDPRQYSDILKKKKKHAKKPNTKGFVVRPKMYARQRR